MFSWNTCLLVMMLGAVAGMFINWGIYNLAWNKRPISPWGPLPEGISNRGWNTRIPILGWLRLKSETRTHGYHFWVRPLWIELGMTVFFGFCYSHYSNLVEPLGVEESSQLIWVQLVPFLCLVCLLCIATFIDFDERMIPDEVTVFGTLLALVIAAFLPESRLLDLTSLESGQVVYLHAHSPKSWFVWTTEPRALLYAMGMLGFWGLASMPKLCTVRYGFLKGARFMLASVLRPRRKSLGKGERRRRKPFPVTTAIATGCMLGWAMLYAIWSNGTAEQWESLLSAVIGMTAGLVLVWGVRIIGQIALRQEAMGFGDVTLMAMIGAFLGWQAVMVTFFLAPFAGVIIGIIQAITRRENEMAFGPYLSLAALVVVLFWESIWIRITPALEQYVDALPFVLMVGLSAMGGMLFAWRLIKEKILA